MMGIEVNDDVIFKFKQKSIVEVYENEDFELNEPVEEFFEKGEEIEVSICGVDTHKFDVQFGNGTIAFIKKDILEIVSVN